MSSLVLGSSVPLTALRGASMDTPSQGRRTMSGQEQTDSRLSRTASGRPRTGSGARHARYDGLPLPEFQKRELRLALDERWPHDTVRSAARELREPLQTVRNWHEGLTFPGGLKLLKLGRHLGLQFLARLDPEPDSELKVAAAILRRQAIEAEMARLSALLADAPTVRA